MSEVNRPGYWLYETSGVLRPVIEAYLAGDVLTDQQIVVLRAYLRQWIAGAGWAGAEIDRLRAEVDGLRTNGQVRRWIDDATMLGADPI